MARSVEEVMTVAPMTVRSDNTVVDAARIMREGDVGAVIVLDGGGIYGIVTDRDVALRAVAEGRDPSRTRVGDICSRDLTTVDSKQSVDEAVRLMREKDVRRLPVVEEGKPVGIVSIGDLAVERDPDSALADISAADPNR